MKVFNQVVLPEGGVINVGDLITHWPASYRKAYRDAQLPFLILEIGYFAATGTLQFKVLTNNFDIIYDQIGETLFEREAEFLKHSKFPTLQTNPGGI